MTIFKRINFTKIRYPELCVLVLLLTGGQSLLFGVSGSNMPTVVFQSIFFFIFCILILFKQGFFNKKIVQYLLFYSFSVIMTMVIRVDYNEKHFYDIFVFVVSALIVSVLDERDFSISFYNVIKFLSIYSLIVFVIGHIAPDVIRLFPLVENSKGYQFRNCFFSVIPDWQLGTLGLRNYGLFREPGVFICYLVFAYFIGEKEKNTKPYDFFIFFFTILSTLSTTGFVLLGAITFYKIISSDPKKGLIFSIFIICFIILIKVKTRLLDLDGPIFVKFMGNSGSADARFFSVGMNLDLIKSYPVFGSGWTKMVSFFLSSNVTTHNTNTILHYFACYGFFVGIIFFYGLIRYFSISTKLFRNIICLLVVFAALSSERLVFDNIYTCFILFGLISRRQKNENIMVV